MKENRIAEIYKECSSLITEQTQEIHQLILGTGNFNADVLFVGEYPSAEEEMEGMPFVGKAGMPLNETLQALGLTREEVFTTHLVKYRPYRVNEKSKRVVSRAPKKEEIQFFIPYLQEEISILSPKIIVTLGLNPLKALMDDYNLKLNEEHGKVRTRYIKGRAYKILPFSHEALRSSNDEESEDFAVLRKLVEFTIKYRDDKEEPFSKVNAYEQESKEEHASKEVLGEKAQTLKSTLSPAQLLKHKLQLKELPNKNSDSGNQDIFKYLENKEDHVVGKSEAIRNEEPIINENIKLDETTLVKQEKSEVIAPKKTKMKPVEAKEKSGKLKTIIIYGGDGYADDPTLVAIDRISHVLTELQTNIIRLDLYKNEYDIKGFFSELEEAQAIVIATTVEWFGIGGHLQMFLDKCWKYGNKKLFEDVYLFGVVISKQNYERDTYNHLIKSWELLGGVEGTNLCASIKKSVELETNSIFLSAIDKKTEEFYRVVHQGRPSLPTSIKSNKVYIEVPSQAIDDINRDSIYDDKAIKASEEVKEALIPNYEAFMEKQQQDIADIANLFKQKITNKEADPIKTIPEKFKGHYIGGADELNCRLQWNINDRTTKNFIMDLKAGKINVYYGNINDFSTVLHLDEVILDKIIEGKMTIQRAFMTGEVKAKGDFTVLYKLDQLFKW